MATRLDLSRKIKAPTGTTLSAKSWMTEAPLRIFMHLVDETGAVIAQSDVLGVPSTQWGSADVFLQYHELWLPGELPAGPYAINIGFYNPENGQRLGLVGEHVDYIHLPLP